MGVITVLGGMIAASSFILTKKPELKVYFDKFAPYQSYLGAILLIYGIWYAFMFIGNASAWLHAMPLRFGVYLAVALLQIALGIMLAYPLINKFKTPTPTITDPTSIGQSPVAPTTSTAEQHITAFKDKLVVYQEKIGLAAIVLGVISLFI